MYDLEKKNRSDIETSALTNEKTDRKRARSGKDIQDQSALKIWFNNVGEKNASINGPLMRQKAEELAKTMDSSVQLMDGLTDGKSERILYCVQAYAWCRKKCRFFSS